MKIPLTKLKSNPNNPRFIKDEAFKKLVKSLKDFPEMLEAREIVVNKDYVILGGNMRFKAAQELGLKELPVKVVDWSEEKQREFIIKDNVSGGEWDWDILANEWDTEELDDWGLDLPDGMQEEQEIEEDEAPEVEETEPAKSKQGTVYQLGRHRLMCGSATSDDDVAKLVANQPIHAIHTDPPYGVDYKSKKLGGIMNDELKDDSLYQFIYDAFSIALKHLESNAGVYCWYEDKYRHIFQTALEDAGLEFKQNLIWNKGMNLSGADYQKAHENVLYLQIKGNKAKWFGERDKKTILGKKRTDIMQMKKQDLVAALVAMQEQSTVWDIDRDVVTTYVHPTQKPVNISARAIKNSTEEDDNVYDGFMGSGSTLIACEQTGRNCYGMELDPKYADVIRKRYAKFVAAENDVPENWEELTPEVA